MTYEEMIERLRFDGTLRDDAPVHGIDLHYLVEVADGWERERIDPQPTTWAACGTCEMAYNLRRCLSMTKGWVWLWERACKHKSEPVVMSARGRAS